MRIVKRETMPYVRGAPFEPTYEQRVKVEALAQVASYQYIADTLAISMSTLVRHFRKELTEGKSKAAVGVGSMILKMALEGNVACLIFYAKTQLGWRERGDPDEVTDPLRVADASDEKVRELINMLVEAADRRKREGPKKVEDANVIEGDFSVTQ